MRLETKQDEADVVFLLAMIRKARIDLNLSEALELLRSCDRLQKALNDFKNPPKIGVVSTEELGKKVVPMKMPKTPPRKK